MTQMDNRSPEGLAGYQASPTSCFICGQLLNSALGLDLVL